MAHWLWSQVFKNLQITQCILAILFLWTHSNELQGIPGILAPTTYLRSLNHQQT
jgi:hypothetical protein